jgi:hypothetical protein
LPAFTGGNDRVEQIHLRAFATAIDAFDGNQPAESPPIYIGTQTSLNSRITHSHLGPQVSLTADILRRNATRARIQIRT